MNKRTKALTTEEYTEIIQAMKEGFCGFRPNERIATALVLEGNLGLRISDVLRLRPCDIVNDGGRYRLEIIEKKTGKSRVFTVPLVIQQYIENYCLRNHIGICLPINLAISKPKSGFLSYASIILFTASDKALPKKSKKISVSRGYVLGYQKIFSKFRSGEACSLSKSRFNSGVGSVGCFNLLFFFLPFGLFYLPVYIIYFIFILFLYTSPLTEKRRTRRKNALRV